MHPALKKYLKKNRGCERDTGGRRVLLPWRLTWKQLPRKSIWLLSWKQCKLAGKLSCKIPSTFVDTSMEASAASAENSAASVVASIRFHRSDESFRGSGENSWEQLKLPWKHSRASVQAENSVEDRGTQGGCSRGWLERFTSLIPRSLSENQRL